MNVILSSVEWHFVIVYLHDIVVFSKTLQQHFGHVRKVVLLLHSAGAILKFNEGKRFTHIFELLGHVIRSRRLYLVFHMTEAISELQSATRLTELRSLLNLCNVFQRLVANVALITASHSQHLKKDYPASFNPLDSNEHNAMETLKKGLISLPILALPYSFGHMTFDTDARNVQTGCGLLQKQPDDKTKPFRKGSRFLTDPGMRYDTIQRECFAIVCAVFLLRPYIEVHRLTIHMDRVKLKSRSQQKNV